MSEDTAFGEKFEKAEIVDEVEMMEAMEIETIDELDMAPEMDHDFEKEVELE